MWKDVRSRRDPVPHNGSNRERVGGMKEQLCVPRSRLEWGEIKLGIATAALVEGMVEYSSWNVEWMVCTMELSRWS